MLLDDGATMLFLSWMMETLKINWKLLNMLKIYITFTGRLRDALQGTCSREAEELGESLLAFTVTVPCLENVTLVITRGFSPIGINQHRRGLFKDIETSCCFSEGLVLEKLLPYSQNVHELFNLPFDCAQYVRRGFFIVR